MTGAGIRLGIVAQQALNPVPGGTGRATTGLVRLLLDAAPPGSAVTTWVAWHRDVQPAAVAGADGPHRLPLPRRALIAAWERGFGPGPRGVDLVHAPTPLFPPTRTPLVVTVHDAVPWSHPETLTPRGVAFHRRMIGRAARRAEVIVVPTAAVRDELANHVSFRRVEVVPHAPSTSLAVPLDAADRVRRFGLDPERGYLLTVSTLEPRKGLDLLVDALATGAAGSLPLAVVGPAGWGDVDVATYADRAGLPPGRVRVLGRVDDIDLGALYGAAVAVVMPSRAEGFGLPMLEAMALGVPVIATSAPALIEVSGGAARIVSMTADAIAHAIHDVASDAALRLAMIERGRERARDFDRVRIGGRLWSLYDELVNAG